MTQAFVRPRQSLSRRRILGITLGAGMAGLLASCAPATPTATAPPAPKVEPTRAAPAASPASKAEVKQPAPAPTTAPAAAPKAAPKEREKVVVRLDWFPLSYHAPFYVGLDKGWYAEQGLDVEVGGAQGSGQAALLVTQGQATFGHIEGSAVVKATSAGQPLKSVALAFGKSMLGFAYGKDLGIRTPKDFEGKNYGAVPFAATHQLWPGFAAAAGIDVSKVNIINIDPDNSYRAIATKQVDIIDAAVGDTFVITEAGRPADIFRLSDHGLNVVGHTISARNDTVQQKPDMVRRFLDMTFRAYDYTRSNAGDALEIFLKRNPDAKRAIEENRLKETIPLWNYSGTQSPQAWQSTVDLVVKYVKLEKAPNPSEIFTNDLLPKR